MSEFFTVVTDVGLVKLLDSMEKGTVFPASTIAIGDSNGNYYEPDSTQTALKNVKYTGKIFEQGKRFNDDGSGYLYFDMQIPASEGGFYIREAGLLDDTGALLAVSKYPLNYKQKADAGSEKNIIIEIRIGLSATAIANITIDNSGNLVKEDNLNAELLLKANTGLDNLTESGKSNIFNLIYPVGSIYMSVNSVDPATLFGIGTWEQIKDRFLLAAGDTYNNAATGGEATHTITTAEMPSHTHSQKACSSTGAHTHSRGSMEVHGEFRLRRYTDYGYSGTFYINDADTSTYGTKLDSTNSASRLYTFNASKNWTGATSSNGAHTHTTTLNNTGSGTAHNNMPPYLAVNVWKRIA